jgi:hypothetical protein
MLSSCCSTLTNVVFLCSVLVSSSATAQTRDPDELVAAYVREHQSHQGHSAAFHELIHVLTNHADYPPADLEKLLGGLEQVALTGEPERLRAEAALALAIPGSKRAVHPIGTFPRLERVYRRSTDPLVRSALIRAMGDLADRREGALFLERIAKQEPADFPDAQKEALTSLLKMNGEGRTVLKRLHETNAVRDPKAKQTLTYLAKQGFRPR